MKLVAKTTDGKSVVSDVWELHSTQGIPFEVSFAILHERNCIPCWLSLYDEAKSHGMKHDRIVSLLDAPIMDVWGPEYRDVIINTLEKVRGQL